ncbi:MAG: hypothetical protein GXP53_02365 [Deltaproteobacteria bacterium]|nr:hypothetical protein [Deltaproteobacteria bacterium]
MKIPQHQVENVLKAYKKHLLSSAKDDSKGKATDRFSEKKRLVRNKILMDIARRTAVLRHDHGVLKPGEENCPDAGVENRIKYHTIGPDGKETHSIDITNLL